MTDRASDDESRAEGRRRETLPRRCRLRSSGVIAAVYREGARSTVGPITVRGRPNERPESRLGFSVPRRVGTAVMRNRIKRLIREAFRRMRHDLPAGYDLVVSVQPHEPLALADYQRLLRRAALDVHRRWNAKP